MAAQPFVFRKVLYLAEASGRRARGLDDLLRLVTVADPSSIGYHMHREFLAYKFAHAEWPNDFAYWAARVLGDEILGERLANLRAFRHATLAELKAELAQVIADHMLRVPEAALGRAPAGRELDFATARKFVLPTGRTARTLAELAGAIAEVESSSLFYHFFETRYEARVPREGDFAAWARDVLLRPDLAARLAGFDPYMFSLEQLRRVLMRILSEAEAGARP